jgi:hypothetical protein
VTGSESRTLLKTVGIQLTEIRCDSTEVQQRFPHGPAARGKVGYGEQHQGAEMQPSLTPPRTVAS